MLLERYKPTFDEIQSAAFTVAGSKHLNCPLNVVWEMQWDEFLAALDWVLLSEAMEYAATKDAHSTR